MKNKWISRLSLFLLSLGLLVGCSSEVVETPVDKPKEETVEEVEPKEVEVSINIIVEGDQIDEYSHSYDVAYGMKLMDIMKEHYRLVEEHGFIQCIEGNGQDEDEGLFWAYDVNGEMGEVGAAEYELQEGDVIDWKLIRFE